MNDSKLSDLFLRTLDLTSLVPGFFRFIRAILPLNHIWPSGLVFNQSFQFVWEGFCFGSRVDLFLFRFCQWLCTLFKEFVLNFSIDWRSSWWCFHPHWLDQVARLVLHLVHWQASSSLWLSMRSVDRDARPFCCRIEYPKTECDSSFILVDANGYQLGLHLCYSCLFLL